MSSILGFCLAFPFHHDADGNLTSDGRTGFEFSYNILNLPMSAEDGADGSTMTYTYLSDGTKLKALTDSGEGLSYRGSFVYGLSAGGGCTLESVATDEGRIVMDGTAVKDEWHVRDHVGNVRSVVWLNAPAGTSISASILEQNDYLPFGTRLPGSRTDQSNRYRLAGFFRYSTIEWLQVLHELLLILAADILHGGSDHKKANIIIMLYSFLLLPFQEIHFRAIKYNIDSPNTII